MSTDRQNPYQSPQSNQSDLSQTEYSTVDARRLTLEECRYLSLNWLQPSGLLFFKLCHIPVPVTLAFAADLVPITSEQLPEEARDEFHPLANAILAQGFQHDFTFSCQPPETETSSAPYFVRWTGWLARCSRTSEFGRDLHA